ncbi:hypothetical protein NDU88_008397 [Pleurodeles waltl]|uniref:Metalloendopeptidase n=1 Tax=Pleurodeles waltl TaxID=8319 RepID=A0AAV7SVK1_PLEWA|nr:hypothetical protein NDU88_008397 [Pleurodeles waltl]
MSGPVLAARFSAGGRGSPHLAVDVTTTVFLSGMSADLEADDGISILEANKGMSADLEADDGISILEANKGMSADLEADDGISILEANKGAAQKAKVSAAMQDIATMTCVTFVPRLTERDYLHIFSGTGCWSPYGKQGGAQMTSLAAGSCLKQGTIQHELMHNLGFYHEHPRKDRDTYINIMWRYVDQDTRLGPMRRMLLCSVDYREKPGAQSVKSARTAYSNTPGKSTLVPKPDPTVRIGQRAGISNLDVAKINALYSCDPGDVDYIRDLNLWWQDQGLRDLLGGVEDHVSELFCDLLLVHDLALRGGIVSLRNLDLVGGPRERLIAADLDSCPDVKLHLVAANGDCLGEVLLNVE